MKKMFNKKFLIGLAIIVVVVGISASKINQATQQRLAQEEILRKAQLQQEAQKSMPRYKDEHLEQIDDMTTVRGGHAMTLLNDGRVLITGGVAYQEPTRHHFNFNFSHTTGDYGLRPVKSAEIFDPKTNTFKKISDMNFPHKLHSSILLKDGTVLIVDDNQCEIFNPKTNKFSISGKIGKINMPFRWLPEYFAVQMPDGNILIAGANSPEIEVYNPKTQEFKIVNKFKIIRRFGVITPLTEQKIMVTGGSYMIEGGGTVKLVEVYDYSTNTVTTVANTLISRQNGTDTLLGSGNVLIAGNDDGGDTPIMQTEIYDPAKNKFTLGPNMVLPILHPNAVKLSNGKVLLAGQLVGKNAISGLVIQLYNPKTNKFEAGINVPLINNWTPVIVLLKNNKVLITGGYKNAGETIKDSWLYSY